MIVESRSQPVWPVQVEISLPVASKTQFWDKETAKFWPGKPNFRDNPLVKLPGAFHIRAKRERGHVAHVVVGSVLAGGRGRLAVEGVVGLLIAPRMLLLRDLEDGVVCVSLAGELSGSTVDRKEDVGRMDGLVASRALDEREVIVLVGPEYRPELWWEKGRSVSVEMRGFRSPAWELAKGEQGSDLVAAQAVRVQARLEYPSQVKQTSPCAISDIVRGASEGWVE
ncbi:hypothetical protein R3P38DRAFT_2786575 [Favolaschia claudopus]|uniref:Uncharacterized protein n=1 Tax=Favolaschia claudopus TaxID=2862362 RepID=A0AAW0AR51_9AGAR